MTSRRSGGRLAGAASSARWWSAALTATNAVGIRPAEEADRRLLALLFAAVAKERDGIAAEPPSDIEKRAADWDLDRTLVALAADEVVGLIFVIESSFGFELAALTRGSSAGRTTARERRPNLWPSLGAEALVADLPPVSPLTSVA
jgi:hypothetical protein